MHFIQCFSQSLKPSKTLEIFPIETTPFCSKICPGKRCLLNDIITLDEIILDIILDDALFYNGELLISLNSAREHKFNSSCSSSCLLN